MMQVLRGTWYHRRSFGGLVTDLFELGLLLVVLFATVFVLLVLFR